jgi:dTDP-4-amino-4,6-dideoxygalactose transaminase
MKEKAMNEHQLMTEGDDKIVLFYPEIPIEAINEVTDTLRGRWIGQGPKVDIFEEQFTNTFNPGGHSISVGAGTHALHLSYLLANFKPGDEVIVPLFTCTATNIPFLYMGVKVVFADIDVKTMNVSIDSVKSKINSKTKGIVVVHYGGLPCDMGALLDIAKKHNLLIIEDAAHALGAKYYGRTIGSISDFTMFSFQAIKHITTGDGGMVTFKNSEETYERAKRLRWFGIDRCAKQMGVWENDIEDIGYKYQMNDISAGMGIAGLKSFDSVLSKRKLLLNRYFENLSDYSRITLVGDITNKDIEHAAWLITIYVDVNRIGLMNKLRENNIESAQVHYRNDRYSIFGGRQKIFNNMDQVEDRYLVLPLHPKMNISDVDRVCDVIKSGW